MTDWKNAAPGTVIGFMYESDEAGDGYRVALIRLNNSAKTWMSLFPNTLAVTEEQIEALAETVGEEPVDITEWLAEGVPA